MKKIKILNRRPYVWMKDSKGKKHGGIAIDNYFASKAWIISQEAYDDVMGEKFGWYCFEDDDVYCDIKYKFELMPEQYIQYFLKKYPEQIAPSIRMGYIEEIEIEESDQPNPNDYTDEEWIDIYYQKDFNAMQYHEDIGDR